MLSAGIPHPRRTLLIALSVSAASWLSIAWGAAEMAAAGVETTRTAAMVGLAIIPAIFGPLLALNVWWAARIVAALRRGENVVGRWRTPPEALRAFASEDKARSALGPELFNDWGPPRRPPPEGVDIIFGKDGVLAHETYVPLTRAGFYTFGHVGLLPRAPLSIEFATTATHVGGGTAIVVRRTRNALRFPILRADCPAALKVLEHYRRPETGTIAADPDFYASRVRFGLIAAPICLLFAGAGFVLSRLAPEDNILPMLMMIFGGVFGVGALLIALLAAIIGRVKRRRG
jgi:hypothetical protein